MKVAVTGLAGDGSQGSCVLVRATLPVELWPKPGVRVFFFFKRKFELGAGGRKNQKNFSVELGSAVIPGWLSQGYGLGGQIDGA